MGVKRTICARRGRPCPPCTYPFRWFAQIAAAGDVINDPSKAWPETRRLVKLGTITIDKLATDQAGFDKRLTFLPGTAPPGIEAPDRMIAVRTAADPVSFGQRQSATTSPIPVPK